MNILIQFRPLKIRGRRENKNLDPETKEHRGVGQYFFRYFRISSAFPQFFDIDPISGLSASSRYIIAGE
jgi:hypothetical protein